MDTVHECDRRTDGRTDRITITNIVQRIASHGKNLALAVCQWKNFVNWPILDDKVVVLDHLPFLVHPVYYCYKILLEMLNLITDEHTGH